MNTVSTSRTPWPHSRLWIAACALAVLVGSFCGFYLVKAINSHMQDSAARAKAWQTIQPRLQEANKAAMGAADLQRAKVQTFFANRKQRTRAFGDPVLSLQGKWEFVKSGLPYADTDGHRRFMREQFETIVVSGAELQDLVKSVVAGYISELKGIENNLLVQLRADLSDSDLARLEAGALLKSEQAFRQEYEHSMELVSAAVGRDVVVQIGRETVTWVGADVAASITVSLLAATAERLGISAGILGAGMASGAATLGVGIAAGFILDAILDSVLKFGAGYDPAGDISAKLNKSLDTFQEILLDGDKGAVYTYEKLRKLEATDLFPFVREECRIAADRMETGGYLGLRRELNRLKVARARLREQALRKLILEGAQQ